VNRFVEAINQVAALAAAFAEKETCSHEARNSF
jgi:hypothetical protein